MKSLFLIMFIFFLVKPSSAQDTSYIIEAGTKANNVIPPKAQYQYPEFLYGKVFFRDGSISEGKLNYSRLMDEIQFITEKGDTLALNNEPTIKFVCIDKDTFCFDQGFIMLVVSYNLVRLGMKQGFRFADKRKAAGYDMMSSTSSVSSLSSFNARNGFYELVVMEQTILVTFTEYYFGDKYNHFVPATKNNLIELFPGCTAQIKSFLKKNDIDFAKRIDLERVMDFLDRSCK